MSNNTPTDDTQEEPDGESGGLAESLVDIAQMDPEDRPDIDDLSLTEFQEQQTANRQQGINRLKEGDSPSPPEDWQRDLDALTPSEQATLLGMCCQSCRGNWKQRSDRAGIICYLTDKPLPLPDGLLAAIEWNAHIFVEGGGDGRIFRDGDRTSGLSGSLATLFTGDDRIADTENGEWHGTYQEVWEYHHEPTDEEVEQLVEYIPNDLTYSQRYETCRWWEQEPVEPDVPHERPHWTAIEYGIRYDARAHRFLFAVGDDDYNPASTLPTRADLVIRPPEVERPIILEIIG